MIVFSFEGFEKSIGLWGIAHRTFYISLHVSTIWELSFGQHVNDFEPKACCDEIYLKF